MTPSLSPRPALAPALALLLAMGCAKPTPPAEPAEAAVEPAVDPAAEAPPASKPIAQGPEALLAGTSFALAYSGYREGQHPDRGEGANHPTRAQIQEDLALLAEGGFGLLRLYDSGDYSAQVLDVIASDGLPFKVMLGAWLQAELSNHEGCEWLTEPIPEDELAANTAMNAEEVARAIQLAQAHPEVVVAINVGNEALVSWNDHLVSAESMAAYMRQVKAAVPQPVTTAENYVALVENAALLRPVVDFLAVHTYPQWEGRDVDAAMPYTIENMQAVRDAYPDTRLAIGEAGWASVADEFGERASEEKQARYVRELTAWAAENNVTTFVFEAFDEPWKGDPGAPMGAEKHWGLYTVDRQPKQLMRELSPG